MTQDPKSAVEAADLGHCSCLLRVEVFNVLTMLELGAAKMKGRARRQRPQERRGARDRGGENVNGGK